MAGAMVNRATTDHLIGPDWAMNMEICDICNRDPGQSKDVVKALKKRLSHKNPKVQLLALTLLETVIKHCGDILHMHVAERDVLHEMVKLVKKKSDPRVKEKVLVLIDTWQESFGGSRARYPQYYAAYHELARAGAEFPKRPDRPAPLFNGQSQAAKSIRSPDQQDEAESSAANDFPALSVSEIQNARGIMDVLAEMLNALDPGNREGLRQDVIVELVDQCRTYKQRVVQLVNSTSDEELMSLGLALNDDLQRVLAKHDAIAAGIAIRVEKKPKSLQALVDTEDSRNQEVTNKEKALVDIEDPTTQDPKQEANQSTNDQSPFEQLALPAPPVANGTTTSAPKADPGIDLLNWDDTPTTAANSLALVPVTDPLTDSTSSNHNALAIVDMFSQNNTTNSNTAPADPFGLNSSSTVPGSQPYNTLTQQPLQSQQPQQAVPYANGIAVNPRTSYNHASQFNNISSGWNSQAANPVTSATQQSLNYNEQSGDLPSPPWEAQVAPSNEVPNGQLGGIHPLPMPAGQMGGMQQMQLQGNNMGAPQTQPMYSNQPGVVGLPQMMQPGQTQMQPGFGNQTAMQPGMAVPQMQPGLGNQYGSLPPNSMPGMPYAGMQAPQMQQAVMMYPQQMLSAQYGAMTQQQQIYGSRLAGYMQHPAVAAAHYYSQGAASYGGYPGTSDLSQKMYGLSMQNSSYMGMNSPYPGANQATATPSPSPSASMGQPIKAAKPEDKFFGDLLSIAKKR